MSSKLEWPKEKNYQQQILQLVAKLKNIDNFMSEYEIIKVIVKNVTSQDAGRVDNY